MATDVNQANRHARRLVLAALGDPESVMHLPAGELDLTLRTLRRGRLLGRLAFVLERRRLLQTLPRRAADALTGALATTRARARVARWELDRLAWALSDMPSVRVAAMKGGAYLLADTPNAGGRLFADVDLLLAEKDLGAVEARMTESGWRMMELTPYDDNYYRVWTHELPPMTHRERDVEVDLHHNVLMRTARLKPDASKMLEAAVPVAGSRFLVLAPVDMLLHAMTHLFFSSEMDDGLRELVDIDDLLRHFAGRDPDFWRRFWPRAAELELARPAFYGLRYAAQLLDSPIPTEVLRASEAARPPAPVLALMDRLVPRALFPQHPDHHSRRTAIARLLLYMRSHWLRMPPLMLARHLAYKFYVYHLKRRPPQQDAQPAA